MDLRYRLRPDLYINFEGPEEETQKFLAKERQFFMRMYEEELFLIDFALLLAQNPLYSLVNIKYIFLELVKDLKDREPISQLFFEEKERLKKHKQDWQRTNIISIEKQGSIALASKELNAKLHESNRQDSEELFLERQYIVKQDARGKFSSDQYLERNEQEQFCPQKHHAQNSIILETVSRFISTLAEKQQSEFIFIPDASKQQAIDEKNFSEWIHIVPSYDPEKEYQKIKSANTNKTEKKASIPEDSELKLDWKTRLKQIFWWLIIAGSILFVYKNFL